MNKLTYKQVFGDKKAVDVVYIHSANNLKYGVITEDNVDFILRLPKAIFDDILTNIIGIRLSRYGAYFLCELSPKPQPYIIFTKNISYVREKEAYTEFFKYMLLRWNIPDTIYPYMPSGSDLNYRCVSDWSLYVQDLFVSTLKHVAVYIVNQTKEVQFYNII